MHVFTPLCLLYASSKMCLRPLDPPPPPPAVSSPFRALLLILRVVLRGFTVQITRYFINKSHNASQNGPTLSQRTTRNYTFCANRKDYSPSSPLSARKVPFLYSNGASSFAGVGFDAFRAAFSCSAGDWNSLTGFRCRFSGVRCGCSVFSTFCGLRLR